MSKGKGKVPCTPINSNLTFETSGKQLGSAGFQLTSKISVEKKGK